MTSVSVIVPNYNHAPFLKQRIESISNQTYQNFEIIILDDCSIDNSREIIESYRTHPKIKDITYNLANSGSAFLQWQKGISQATGDYIWIAESDDWAHPEFLSQMVTLADETENIGIVFCASNWVDGNGNPGKDLSIYTSSFKRSGKVEIQNYLVQYNTIQNASAVLLNANLAKKYIHKVVNYTSCGDWFLYILILQHSTLVFTEVKLNNFRWYHNNTSNYAEKNGLWVKEGLRILAFSTAYKNRFTFKQLVAIKRTWKSKVDASGINKRNFYWLYVRMIALFTIKHLLFKLFRF